jgi:hypothetical protein
MRTISVLGDGGRPIKSCIRYCSQLLHKERKKEPTENGIQACENGNLWEKLVIIIHTKPIAVYQNKYPMFKEEIALHSRMEVARQILYTV